MAVLYRHIEQGGWGMWPLVTVLAVVVAATLRRYARYLRARRGIAGVVDAVVIVARDSGDVAPAIDLCIDVGSPFALVVGRALAVAHRPFAAVRWTLDAEKRAAFATLTQRRALLPALAAVGTLLGLFGTFTGYYTPLGYSIGNTKATSYATMLAKGTSEALNCTALGLLVALTCVVAHAVLTVAAERLVAHVDLELARLTNALEPRAPYKVHGLRGESPRAGYRG